MKISDKENAISYSERTTARRDPDPPRRDPPLGTALFVGTAALAAWTDKSNWMTGAVLDGGVVNRLARGVSKEVFISTF